MSTYSKETAVKILRRFTVDVVIVLVTTSERTSCLFLNQTFMVKDTPPSLYRVCMQPYVSGSFK